MARDHYRKRQGELQSDQAPSDPVKVLLHRLVTERGIGFGPLSRAIGKNHAYLQQFMKGRTPRVLPAGVRTALGRYFAIDPEEFRPPDERFLNPPAQRSLDPDLIARANQVARYIIGERADHEWIRNVILAAAYALLEAGLMSDDEETLRVLELAGRRLLAGPTKPQLEET
jgi:hypothetical protein